MNSCVLERAASWVRIFEKSCNPLEIKSTTALKEVKAIARVTVRLREDLGLLVFVSIVTLSYHPWVDEVIYSKRLGDGLD